MTEAKKISKNIRKLMENPLVLDTLNRNSNIDPVIESVKNFWGYDLFNRKPSPAYNDYGLFQGTDLDLACFLYSMADRGAVINIPRYKSMCQSKVRADQKLTSKSNRHGKIIGVQANKDYWTFSINVIDENVIGEDKVGDFRTFSLTDMDGTWYPGWDRIEFVPTLRENKFITENRLWSGNQIVFRNMIHPNRWTSFFGHHYIITKMLINRLEEESKFLNAEIKRLKAEGIEFPKGDGPKSYEYESYRDAKSVKVEVFHADIFMPKTKYVGEYPKIKSTQKDLVEAYNTRKSYQAALKRLRFMTRATEYAHSKAPANLPSWIKGVTWEPGFKLTPRARNTWERLKLFQDSVGVFSVSLIRRWSEKSARVSADY